MRYGRFDTLALVFVENMISVLMLCVFGHTLFICRPTISISEM